LKTWHSQYYRLLTVPQPMRYSPLRPLLTQDLRMRTAAGVAGVEAIAVGSYSRVVNPVRQIEQGAVPRRSAVLARAFSVLADLERDALQGR